jgi:predicted membrane channel-forming protein YqfA (hemolysin III family)
MSALRALFGVSGLIIISALWAVFGVSAVDSLVFRVFVIWVMVYFFGLVFYNAQSVSEIRLIKQGFNFKSPN